MALFCFSSGENVGFLGHFTLAGDLGVGRVSFVEMLILFELWAGERLCLEGAVPKCRRVGRPISISAVPFGPGIDIWRSCRFLGAIFRAFCLLPGGLRRFIPGGIGANHFDILVGRSVVMVFRPGLARLLLFVFWMSFFFFLGILLLLVLVCLPGPCLFVISLRILLVRFLLGCLPGDGSVAGFVASGGLVRGSLSALSAALGGADVCLARGSRGGVKRVRQNRKTPAHLARQGVPGVRVRPRVWKRLRDPLGSDSGFPGAKFLRVHQEAGGHDPGFARAEIG